MRSRVVPKVAVVVAAFTLFVALTLLAQPDKYSLKVPSGLAFSEFSGYESWQVISVSHKGDELAGILGNPAMIYAYQAGLPGSGKPFPDGAKMAKVLPGTDGGPGYDSAFSAFGPVTLSVKVGTTVTWINHDDDTHTVDSTQEKFKLGTLNKGGRFDFRFTEAGEYPFYCRFHPKITGKIIVQP